MSTFTWETAQAQLNIAWMAGIKVVGHPERNVYEISSRSADDPRKVWVRGALVHCSCELSALGGKPCPHGALAFFRAAWDRATEVTP